ncbi:GNAT family N-acetyltransferase [Paenibacillus luteus]|uniref:GNAT family N-acetyltransferase n=1 Tax=Paenibacillus luteus TaxID=2545753 RepID=UPI0011435576|nr:GNAT family N-acetyltransferase [Paenibacillus luteus]
MRILSLTEDNKIMQEEAARLLLEGFAHAWNDWNECLLEVEESLLEDRISRVAVHENGQVVGWIAGASNYGGNVWDLHPLVVHKDYQGQGIGRALVADFESCVSEKGGMTIFLGTDDEDNGTSLYGQELYPDVLENLKQIQNRNHHPFGFYEKAGFTVVGVLPDANGFGKPDIFMAKRVAK